MNYITVKQAAEKLGVTQQAIYNRIKRGGLPKKKILGIYVIDERRIEKE